MAEPVQAHLARPVPAPDAEHAAQQMVLRRAVDEAWTRDEVTDVLGALGLIRSESGGRYDVNGRRYTIRTTGARDREGTS